MSESPPQTETEPRYAWVVVWASFTALAVIFGVAYSFAAFFESFAAQFKASRAEVSLVFGLSGLLYFVLGAFGGMLADRFGPRRVTGAGMLCIAAALGLGSVATSMLQLTLLYGVGLGVGIALVYTPAIGCVQPWFTRRRGLAAGIASAGIGAGTFSVPLLATAAIAHWQWRGATWALAAGVLALGLTATMLLRSAPAASRRADGSVPGTPLAEALRAPSFVWLYAMCALGAPAMFIPFAHLSAAARDLGIRDAQAVGLVGLIGIGSLTGRFAIGAIADRVGRPLTLVGVEASLGLSMLLWLTAGGYPALAVFALWMGLSYGGHRVADAGFVHGPVRRARRVVHHRHALHRRSARQRRRAMGGRPCVRRAGQLCDGHRRVRGAVAVRDVFGMEGGAGMSARAANATGFATVIS